MGAWSRGTPLAMILRMAYASKEERDDALLLVVDTDEEAGRALADHFTRRGFRSRTRRWGRTRSIWLTPDASGLRSTT